VNTSKLSGSFVLLFFLALKNLNMILSNVQAAFTRLVHGAEKSTAKQHFFSLADKLIDGTPVSMDRFQGDVLCVVNVASK
jgi:hypothetical protein